MSMTTGHEERAGPALAPVPLVYVAFALGLTIAIVFRVLVIQQHFAPGWGRPMWSFVVDGNLAFFYYRYRIAEKRKRAVDEHGSIARIEAGTCFCPLEREALAYLSGPSNGGPRTSTA